MNIFEYRDYRLFLRDQISSNNEVRGYQTRLAGVARCQRSVVSQVVNKKAHFTLEQAALLAEYWGMKAEEGSYFLALVGNARAGNAALKKYLRDHRTSLKAAHQDLQNRFKEKKLSSLSKQTLYYSNWINAAVHVLVSVEGYDTSQAIATRLKVSNGRVLEALMLLNQLDLVSYKRKRWVQKNAFLHLPKNSPLTGVNHANWRSKAIEKISELDEDDLNFSSVLSCSIEDFETIKSIMLKAVDQVREVVKTSNGEEICGFNIDFFKL